MKKVVLYNKMAKKKKKRAKLQLDSGSLCHFLICIFFFCLTEIEECEY